MNIWPFSAFRKTDDVEKQTSVETSSPLQEKFMGLEKNILIVASKKEGEMVTRLVNELISCYNSGYVFGTSRHIENNNGKINVISYDEQILENIILKQKAMLDSYDSVPSILVFDACGMDNLHFQALNGELRYTTVTIIRDLCSISEQFLAKMDNTFLFKCAAKWKEASRDKELWERKYKKRITCEEFRGHIRDNLGGIKTVLIAKDKIYSVKLSRNGSTITDICSFVEKDSNQQSEDSSQSSSS